MSGRSLQFDILSRYDYILFMFYLDSPQPSQFGQGSSREETSSFEKIKHNPDENTVGIALFPPPGWMVITMKTLCRPKDLIRPDSEVIYCCDVC